MWWWFVVVVVMVEGEVDSWMEHTFVDGDRKAAHWIDWLAMRW